MKLFFILILFFTLFGSSTLHADALVMNQAMKASTIIEFHIDETGIRAELEIGIEALADFKNLLPDAIYRYYKFAEKNSAERQLEFFSKQLAIQNKEGKPLSGTILATELSRRTLRNPISGTPLPIQQGAPEVIKAKLHYRFHDNELPEQIRFPVPMVKNIGFVVYHQGVAVNDFRYLNGNSKLNLDWKDPWYTRFESRKLRRQYHAPMSGFIYIEPFEVRKEIIVRPKDLQRWVDLGLENKKTIPISSQGIIKEKIAAFLAEHHPVSVDGERVEGSLYSVNFLERTLTSSRVIDPPEELNIDAAIVGAIFVYPRDGLPQEVIMEWDLWDERINVIPTSAVDQEGPFESLLEPDWNKLIWKNFLKKPIVPTLHTVETPVAEWRVFLHNSVLIFVVLSLLALLWLIFTAKQKRALVIPAGLSFLLLTMTATAAWLGDSNTPTPQRANAIVNDLLHNIYRAFDYHEESHIYDVLARSVTGDLLTDIFLETKRSLVLSNQGGARAKVKGISLKEMQLKPNNTDNSFTAEATWTVNGSVGHWGHIHQRNNLYRALLTFSVDEQQWKLEKMSVLQEERL